MKSSMIVYGVKGGKTRFAERIAEFYGLKQCVMRPTMAIRQTDEIGFIEEKASKFWEEWGFTVKSFEEVAEEINAAIPVTEWISGLPVRDGVYERDWDISRFESRLDLFKEGLWHIGGGDGNYEECTRNYVNYGRNWRGLSQEPINTEE